MFKRIYATLLILICLSSFWLSCVSAEEGSGAIRVGQPSGEEDILYRYPPTSIEILTGDYVNGSLLSLYWTDRHYLIINSVNGEVSLVLKFANLTADVQLDRLSFDVITRCEAPNVNIVIQTYDYTSQAYVSSGEGYYTYTSSHIPIDEDVNVVIAETPSSFVRNNEAKIKISAYKPESDFQLKINLALLNYGSLKVAYNVFEGYLQYLKNMYVGGRGYRCFPFYNVRGGDYFNYWTDDHGKLLLAFAETRNYDEAKKCVEFIRNCMVGNYLVGRVVDSSLYEEGELGDFYFVTNRIVGIGNYSAVEEPPTNVYEKVASLAHVVFTPSEASYLAGIFLFDADINGQRYLLRPPSSWEIYKESSGESIKISMLVSVKPEWNIIGWVNMTVEPHKDYVKVEASIINNGFNIVTIDRFGVGFANLYQFIDYMPLYSFVRLANGTTYRKTHYWDEAEPYYIWNTTYGSYPKVVGFSGYKTPEFAKGFMLKILNYTEMEEVNYVYDMFGRAVRVVPKVYRELYHGQSTGTFVFYITPMDKFQMDRFDDVSRVMENIEEYPDIDLSMPASWGIITYALVKYAKNSGYTVAEDLAKRLWNYYGEEVAQRIDRVYYRSLYSHALAGLKLDPTNSTYIAHAERVANTIITQWQVINESSPAYGGLVQALEENGWAYALLKELYKVTGNSTYNDRAELIRGSIKYDQSYGNLRLYNLRENGHYTTTLGTQ